VDGGGGLGWWRLPRVDGIRKVMSMGSVKNGTGQNRAVYLSRSSLSMD
jgi:hypothetical protein